jgi:hypothetical protein
MVGVSNLLMRHPDIDAFLNIQSPYRAEALNRCPETASLKENSVEMTM